MLQIKIFFWRKPPEGRAFRGVATILYTSLKTNYESDGEGDWKSDFYTQGGIQSDFIWQSEQ